MPDAEQSLETNFLSRRGISVKRTKRTKQGCNVLLTGPAGQRLKLPIEGPGSDTDQRLLGELLFYSHCPDDAAKIRKDDEITDGCGTSCACLQNCQAWQTGQSVHRG